MRRTRDAALATRDSILDAAEELFVEQGVSRTTLQQIACRAQVTRGAIYWHFTDKGALFNAMMERAKLPLESAMQTLEVPDPADPLGDLHNYAMRVFELTETDDNARRVFKIATLKVEFVDDVDAALQRRTQVLAAWMARAESRVGIAVARGQAGADTDPRAVALGLWAILDGLVRGWMIAPGSFSLRQVGAQVVGMYLGALRR